jgi:membrane-anchored protein YejM (alkaline phosphatase superfamily)
MMLALALVEPTAVVRGPMKVPAEGFYAAAPLVLLLLLVSVLYAWRRRRIRASARRRCGVMASFALSVALGNALVELGSFFDASRPVAMAMEPGDCDRTPDERGDGRDPLSPGAPETGCDR